MKKILLILFIFLFIPLSGYCGEKLLTVGQKCVTTKNADSVFVQNTEDLIMYLYCTETEDRKMSPTTKIIFQERGIIWPVKSGVLVLITEVEKDVLLYDNKYTVYTVHPDGTADYYRTFGKGLKAF